MVTVYQVGGSVRDEILGVKTKDFDFAVEAGSYAEMRDYIKTHGKIFLEKEEYLTIRAKVGDKDADYVLCRKEGLYSDGRRPDTVQIGNIDDDLARRDFTINAIAKREDGSYYDPHNGREDVEKGFIQCVGDTEERFREDSLRLLRALRFAITKQFILSPEIMRCLKTQKIVGQLKNVSTERIREELFKCFKHDTAMTLQFLELYKAVRYEIFGAGWQANQPRIWLEPTMRA